MILYKAADGYECDECEVTGVPLVEMQHGEDDGVWCCAPCLRKALALIEECPCAGMPSDQKEPDR